MVEYTSIRVSVPNQKRLDEVRKLLILSQKIPVDSTPDVAIEYMMDQFEVTKEWVLVTYSLP